MGRGTDKVVDFGRMLGNTVEILLRPGEKFQDLDEIRVGQRLEILESPGHLKAVFRVEGFSFRRVEEFIFAHVQHHGVALQRESPIIIRAERIRHIGVHDDLVVVLYRF
jgi:hypothetical protein